MPSRQDDAVAWHARGAGGRSFGLGVGLVLAVAACAASFLTDDARYLRLAVMAAAWAFVAAAFVAGRRRGEQHAGSAREEELRRAYERELDHAAAARREFELELENDLRREAEEAMRAELAVLRQGLAELAILRQELAELAALRADVAALAGLRADVAALAGLREELGPLADLRADVGRLRGDLGRLRADLGEQLGGEMQVERIIMRTQAARLPADQGAPLRLDARTARAPEWSGRSGQEATGPRTAALSLGPPPQVPAPEPQAPTPLEWLSDRALVDPQEIPGRRRSRHSAADPALAEPPSTGPRTAETPAGPARPVPYRRRRTDDGAPALPDPAEAATRERSYAAPAVEDRAEPAREPEPAATRDAPPDGYVRVEEILAENAASAGTPRRRRRYREDDETDDVLARVLGRN